jgi:16S rRNA (guanine(966)-N(2))-methyltransferase RsmD
MRVIAGSLKGRRLRAPTWEGLRPTSDRLRETLFNILSPRIAGARVLDLYAGTGAVGIEALSRGAAGVTFVERDRRARALIAENLAHCGVVDGYTIVQADALRALESLDRAAPFDIVFLDPPYSASERDVARVLSAAGDHLAGGGVVVLERPRRRAVPEAAARLVRSRDVVSGSSALSFFAVNAS